MKKLRKQRYSFDIAKFIERHALFIKRTQSLGHAMKYIDNTLKDYPRLKSQVKIAIESFSERR